MVSKKLKTIVIVFTVASLLFLLGFLYLKNDRGYLNTNNPCLEGYYVYPLDRGYGPGSIITVERFFGNENKIKVSSLQFSSKRLISKLVDKDILSVESLGNLSGCSSFSYDQFDVRLLLKSDDTELSEIEINPVLSSVKDVKIEVNNGKRYSLKSGESAAFQDVISNLPAVELENILRELNRGGELYFVSEVAVYDDAVISMTWNDTISEKTKNDLLKSIKLSGNYEWSSTGDLKIQFAEGSNVGFMGRFFTESDIDFIKSTLDKRINEGDLILLFEDKDGDGSGSNVEGERRLFGIKQDWERVIGGKTVKYVKNNLDTSDNDNNRGPGEKEWYKDQDGDGYGDAGVFVIGINCPEGYVSNPQDCYDNNPNAFPGQVVYFASHRGDGSFDYDCNTNDQSEFTNTGGCVRSCKSLRSGWESKSIPSCGESAAYVTGCSNGNWPDYSCTVFTSQKIQRCR